MQRLGPTSSSRGLFVSCQSSPGNSTIHSGKMNVNPTSRTDAWLHWTSDHNTDKILFTSMPITCKRKGEVRGIIVYLTGNMDKESPGSPISPIFLKDPATIVCCLWHIAVLLLKSNTSLYFLILAWWCWFNPPVLFHKLKDSTSLRCDLHALK